MLIPLVLVADEAVRRALVACLGIAIFAASCFMNTTSPFDSAGDQFFLSKIVRAIGQAW